MMSRPFLIEARRRLQSPSNSDSFSIRVLSFSQIFMRSPSAALLAPG
jgi:hypothetical protein